MLVGNKGFGSWNSITDTGDSPDRFVCLRDLRHLRAVGQLHPVLWDLEKGGEHKKKHRFVRLETNCSPLLLLFQQKMYLRGFKF